MSAEVVLEEATLSAWVAAYGPELRAHLRRFVAPDDAEDLLQQVWMRAHARPPDGGPASNPRAWLYRVATNAALDRLSRDRRRKTLLEAKADQALPEPPSAPDAGAEVTDGVRARVRAAVARLPRKQREAVWLRWADGLEYEVIAERLGCSRESARANVYQGMKRLREQLAELLSEETP